MVWVCEYVRSSADVCEHVYVYLCAYLCDTEPQITSCPPDLLRLTVDYTAVTPMCISTDILLSITFMISKRFLNIIFWPQEMYIALQRFILETQMVAYISVAIL